MMALAAASAQAAATTTEPATGLTATAAVLHGVVITNGTETAWEFQYGRTASYGSATPVQLISAGVQTVDVSAELRNLKPSTTYHFRLVTITRGPSPYYYLSASEGADRTFTTKGTGRLLLDSTKLRVHKGKVSVRLTCSSTLPCKGKFSITLRTRIRRTRRFATIVCTKAQNSSYSLGANRSQTLTKPVHGSCVALLKRARHHQLVAKLSSYPRTGQHAVVKAVTLTLR
jgi:hypothetical protein